MSLKIAMTAALLMTSVCQSVQAPWTSGRTTVPDTLLSLELEDELRESEPDPEEPPIELDDTYEESCKGYSFFTESGLFGSIDVTELKSAGGWLPWLVYFRPEEEDFKLAADEEIPGLKLELEKSERWRFGKRFAAFSHSKTTFDGQTMGNMLLTVGGKSEMIEIAILVDQENKAQVQEARHILESVLYDGQAPSNIEGVYPKP